MYPSIRTPATAAAILVAILCGTPVYAESQQKQPQQAGPSTEQLMLQRIYQMRMRFEQERAQNENEARANVRLATSGGGNRGVDSPTVSGLRQQTNQQLARFESKFECLDIDVDGNNGNTVVICGDNSGDITGTNVSAQRDIVTVNGGRP